MPIFNRIRSQVTTKEVKYAFIELACLLLFSDKKSKLSEQDLIKGLIDLESNSSERLEEKYQATMAKVNGSGFKSDAMIENIHKSLGSQGLKSLACEFIDHFVHVDGNSTAAEVELAKKIKNRLSK